MDWFRYVVLVAAWMIAGIGWANKPTRLPPVDPLVGNAEAALTAADTELELETLPAPELPLHDPSDVVHSASDIPFTPTQQSEVERLIAEAVDANHPSGLRFGYENGFVINSPSGMKIGTTDVTFRMRINSWSQFRHTVFDSDGTTADQNDFEFERLRLTFQGNAYSPHLRYFIQLDGDSDQSSRVDWLDYYLTFNAAKAAGCKQRNFGLKVGVWKLPFNRARAESGWKMAFSDRAVASVLFDINRSQAVALWGDFGLLGRTVNWETALSNGFKTSGLRPFRNGELDKNPAFSSRMWSDWIGIWGNDGESDLSYHECCAMRVGAGFAFTRLDREGLSEFNDPRAVDSGTQLGTLVPAAVDAYNMFLYSVDANWKYRGCTVLTEYYFRQFNEFAGAAVSDLFDHGFLLQTGLFVVRERVELLARWSRVVGDSGTLGATTESFDEVGAGAVLYLNGHRAKFTFDATHLNGAPIRDGALNIGPGDDGMLYRTQFQLFF